MTSSEILYCKECGQRFDTVEALREHMAEEARNIELRSKGFDHG